MKDFRRGLGVKNISDLILKEIYGIYGEKDLTKEETKNYKMTEREIYELNTKSNKNTFVRNNDMTNIIKHCRGEKKNK